MKLFMNKNEKYEEPEVHMFFHKQTKEAEQVEKFVRSLSITVPVQYEDEIYKFYRRSGRKCKGTAKEPGGLQQDSGIRLV